MISRLILALVFSFGVRCVALSQTVETDTESNRANKNSHVKVGAYYYPWYQGTKSNSVPGETLDRGWMSKALRSRLVPQQMPKLGVYDSRDSEVIANHIRQSQQANIAFWSVSWWGPRSKTDRTLRNNILKHPDCSKLKYAILYETTGRFGNAKNPNYEKLISDFEYLQEHYFEHANYLRIDGKPVVFFYLTRVYFRQQGKDALKQLRARFPNVYLIGDEVFGTTKRDGFAGQWDAITAYDVYGQSLKNEDATSKAIELLKTNYANARKIAAELGTAFVPAVSPGFNDRAVREGHPGRGRFFVDDPQSREGDVFRTMLKEIAVPMADPRADRIVMVTSFNEWYEDTQIESTKGSTRATNRDDSPSGSHYTEGQRYEDYGSLYLDILREMTQTRTK